MMYGRDLFRPDSARTVPTNVCALYHISPAGTRAAAAGNRGKPFQSLLFLAYERPIMRNIRTDSGVILLKTTVFNRYKNGAKQAEQKHCQSMFGRGQEKQDDKEFKTIVFERSGFYIIENNDSGSIWRFEKNCYNLLKRLS